MDARTGQLRLRVMLPEKLSMLAANVDGLRGRLLAIDENGQRIFALTASGLTVVQLARVPLGLGTVSPASASSAGGTALMTVAADSRMAPTLPSAEKRLRLLSWT